MEGQEGLEPSTPCLRGRCSNQLSYWPVNSPSIIPYESYNNKCKRLAAEVIVRPKSRGLLLLERSMVSSRCESVVHYCYVSGVSGTIERI